MKVKPKKAKVSGLPTPRFLRSTAAWRPNSIKRVLSGWPGELRRLLRPGGIATLTVHGRHAFQMFLDGLPPGSPARSTHAANFHTQGIVFVKTDHWTGNFPDFYHNSYNDVSYIFNHWTRFLDVCCYIPRGALNYQDLIVLQRSTDDGNTEGDRARPMQVLNGMSRRRKLHLAWRLLRQGLGLRREGK
jgi:hypothetical protein